MDKTAKKHKKDFERMNLKCFIKGLVHGLIIGLAGYGAICLIELIL